jgi:hypothetical protein
MVWAIYFVILGIFVTVLALLWGAAFKWIF